jgi:6-pyruvoyltetrahydropterin/6-carboxytetrahydropterin synthase
MYTITKEHHFSASHVLAGLPDAHPCGRLHGHNIIVRIELAADTLDPVGFVVDYGDLAPWKNWLDDTFDHKHLNDVVPFNPTAENFAAHIFGWCQARGWPVTRVGWSETPKTWAYFEPSP